MKKRRILRLASLLLVGILMLSGCTGIDQDGHANQGPLGDDLICLDYNSYTGYVGGKYVFNVASILVKNQSETYLEYATIQCDIGSRKGTFQIEGLPPGQMCWVLEQDLMSLSQGEKFVATACDTFLFNPDALLETRDLHVTIDGNTMYVTNQSGKMMTDVEICFKNWYSQGVLFGGEVYKVTISELAPGDSASQQHAYLGDSSQIVKFSYQ